MPGVLHRILNYLMRSSEISHQSGFANDASTSYHLQRDPYSQAPLFNADNWQTAKQIMSLIENGYLSDPPDIPFVHGH